MVAHLLERIAQPALLPAALLEVPNAIAHLLQTTEPSRQPLIEEAPHRTLRTHPVEQTIAEGIGEPVGGFEVGKGILRAIPSGVSPAGTVRMVHSELRSAE